MMWSVFTQQGGKSTNPHWNNKGNPEHALLLINDLPGVTARGVLSPSRSVVGASDLTIVVERNPFDTPNWWITTEAVSWVAGK